MANQAESVKKAESAPNPYLAKDGDQLVITKQGHKYLNKVLTDTTGRVYVFNHHIPPVMVAAAMARLSRRPGDMRLTILDEFAQSETDADSLIHRVVTAYGDDSVQQLAGLHFVVEGASNLMTKLLEWGRFMGALEQSSRYIYFDQQDADGNYLYLKLDHLPAELKASYEESMTAIFETYSTMVRSVTDYVRTKYPQGQDNRSAWLASTRAQACDAARAVLPAATKSTVGLFGSAQAVDSLIMHLLSEPLPEAQEIGQQILDQARQIIPAFLERTDRPDRGGATTAYRATNRQNLRQLAREYLGSPKPLHATSDVSLIDFWPRQEMDLVPEMLFESSDLSLAEIQRQVSFWSNEQKLSVIKAYCGERLNRRHKPGRAIEKAHFEFEFDGKDYGTFRDLQRHRVVDAMEWQHLTPYFGYDLPELIKQAGSENDYHACFAISQQLYQKMVDAGFEAEAQYAVLYGHKMRYRFTMNLRQLFHFIELRTSPQGHPGYRKICQRMYELISEVYPHLAAEMIFVNQGEDPELTRLAAERATAFKLQQMGLSPDAEE